MFHFATFELWVTLNQLKCFGQDSLGVGWKSVTRMASDAWRTSSSITGGKGWHWRLVSRLLRDSQLLLDPVEGDSQMVNYSMIWKNNAGDDSPFFFFHG